MSRSAKMDLNLKALKWARQNINLKPEELPSKLFREQIKEIESGKKKLTLIQANKLAKCYGVSVYFFYQAPKHEKFITEIPDFRSASHQKNYSSSLRMLIQKMKQRQDWLREYLQTEKAKPLSFVGSYNVKAKSQKLADDIIKTFFNSRDEFNKFKKGKDKKDFLNEFIKKLSMHNIIVLKCASFNNNSIHQKEAQGFLLVDKYAPFIFINSKDHPTAQIFTLMHELAHLFIGEEGVSGGLLKKNHSSKIETFCNEVASKTLLSDKELEKNLKPVADQAIRDVSKKHFISSLSILLRLKSSKKITTNQFNKMWEDSKKEIQDYFEKQNHKSGGGHYYNTHLSRTNKKFIQIVYNAYRSESISGATASFLLNIKYNKLKPLYNKAIKAS